MTEDRAVELINEWLILRKMFENLNWHYFKYEVDN